MDTSTIFMQSLFAFFSTLGFGILFNIKGHKLFYAGLGGGLSWLISLCCQGLGMDTTSSFFISSIKECIEYLHII